MARRQYVHQKKRVGTNQDGFARPLSGNATNDAVRDSIRLNDMIDMLLSTTSLSPCQLIYGSRLVPVTDVML